MSHFKNIPPFVANFRKYFLWKIIVRVDFLLQTLLTYKFLACFLDRTDGTDETDETNVNGGFGTTALGKIGIGLVIADLVTVDVLTTGLVVDVLADDFFRPNKK